MNYIKYLLPFTWALFFVDYTYNLFRGTLLLFPSLTLLLIFNVIQKGSRRRIQEFVRNNINGLFVLVGVSFYFFIKLLLNFSLFGLIDILFIWLAYVTAALFKINHLRFFLKSFIVLIGIQSCVSSLFFYADYNATKDLIFSHFERGEIWDFGDQVSYAMCGLFIVPIWTRLKSVGNVGWLYKFFIAVILFNIIVCQYATPLVLLIASFITHIFYFFYQKKKLLTSIVSLLFLIIIIFKFGEIANKFEKSNSVEKIILALEDPKSGGYREEFYDESRYLLAMKSLSTFISNPIFGVGDGYINTGKNRSIGGHSSLFDFLGFYGLVGTLLFLLFLYINVDVKNKEQNRLVDLSSKISFYLFTFSGIGAPYYLSKLLFFYILLSFNKNNIIRNENS